MLSLSEQSEESAIDIPMKNGGNFRFDTLNGMTRVIRRARRARVRIMRCKAKIS